MASFNPQPDEGYSEDPLTAPSSALTPFSLKRDDVSAALSSRRDEYPPWLLQHISRLSTSGKTGTSSPLGLRPTGSRRVAAACLPMNLIQSSPCIS
jgi:hypothetical protein